MTAGAKRGRWLQHDPDPQVSVVSEAIFAAGGNFEEIARLSGLGNTTVAKIAYKETRWPRNETLDRIMLVLGYRKEWTKLCRSETI